MEENMFRSFWPLGLLVLVLAFCGLGDRLKEISGGSNTSSNTATAPEKDKKDDVEVEKATLNGAQQAIKDGGTEVKWDDQNISFTVPGSWKKMNVSKQSFNYGSPDNAFLIATISDLPSSVPADVSLKATYESALENLKQGKYEKVRWVEIDGIKGVEWWEAMPQDKGDPRRYQWIAFRNYQGQNQQLNIILSTKASNFDKHRDDFPAVMYSMKIAK